SKKARAALDAFFEVLLRLRARPRAPVGPLVQAIVGESGYRRELLLLEDEVERSRVENVDELVAAAHEADRLDPTTTLEAFLERTALVAEQDGLEAGAPRVSLMTVHAAKGLEFDGVVVVGAEEGWFPHARSTDRAEEVEEERRLFYVAMTRARRRLALTHAQQRESWNGLERRLPSRFLLDVPDELVAVRDPSGTYARGRARAEVAATAKARPFGRGARFGGAAEDVVDDAVDDAPDELPAVARPAEADADVGPVVARGEAAGVRVGERVAHPYFGHGEVVAATGSGPSSRVTVAFDEAGTRTMLWTLANLTRLPPAGGGGRP
ncbi:MAG: ATP-binding domain-containing protein, partial [Planctomycetia bacterium]|nr:ATP-binding domain-containing protein [Planctomycetia bacterium]